MSPTGKCPQVCLVTGAGKRLGRAVALNLAQHGGDVVIHYLNSADEAESVAQEITSLGRRAWTLRADLANPDDASGLIGRAIRAAGPIGGLVNCASIYPQERLLELTEESLIRNIRINAWAPFVMMRELAAQGATSVVNFLDTRMRDYDARHVSYHLSKRMLFTFTRMGALEFAPNMRVNAVAPGLVLPPPGKDESYLKELSPTNPLNAHGDAEDVASAVVFLLSSLFITGQVIYIDGGRHMLGGLYD